jgi:DnaJ like chaperone protein
MSIWGKVSGAAAGLFVAGPVGALVGAVAGHFFLDRDGDPGVTFTIAIIALAGQIARLFMGNPAMLEDILDGLFEIAKADGVLHPCEAKFLERVAEIFGFAPNEFRRIRASHFAPELTDPYVILGVSYAADDDELKQTYRRLVRENHPDSLMARGVPAEFIKLANDKLAAINTAYEKIQSERGLK